MIPVVYDKSDNVRTSNGLGRLIDCIECTVEQNAEDYSCELHIVYPMNGKHAELLTFANVIGVQVEPQGNIQLFDVYSIKESSDGKIEADAHHVRQRLKHMPTAWVYGTTFPNIIRSLNMVHVGAKQGTFGNFGTLAGTKNFGYHSPFTFWTNITQDSLFYQAKYINLVTEGNTLYRDFYGDDAGDYYSMVTSDEDSPSFWDVLFGSEGLVSVYGLSVKFDNFDIYISNPDSLTSDLSDSIKLRYGKNIAEFARTIDYSDFEIYTHVIPYHMRAKGEARNYDSTTSSSNYSSNDHDIRQYYMEDSTVDNSFPAVVEIPDLPIEPSYNRYIEVDMSGTSIAGIKFRAIGYNITEEQVQTLAGAIGKRLNSEKVAPTFEIKMSNLRASGLYGEYASTESLKLNDIVTVLIDPINVVVNEQVLQTSYNVLLEQYEDITIGSVRNRLADILAELFEAETKNNSSDQYISYSSEVASYTTSKTLSNYDDGTLTWYHSYTINPSGGNPEFTRSSERLYTTGRVVSGNLVLRPWPTNPPSSINDTTAVFATLTQGTWYKVATGLPVPAKGDVWFTFKTPKTQASYVSGGFEYYDVDYHIDSNGYLYARPKENISCKYGKRYESASYLTYDFVALRAHFQYICKETNYDTSWKSYITTTSSDWKERETE